MSTNHYLNGEQLFAIEAAIESIRTEADSKAGTARNHAGNLQPLMAALGSKDKSMRGKAREFMLSIGEQGV